MSCLLASNHQDFESFQKLCAELGERDFLIDCIYGTGFHGELKAEIKVSGNEDINDFDVVVVQEAERVVYDQDSEGNNIVSVPAGWNIDSISAE